MMEFHKWSQAGENQRGQFHVPADGIEHGEIRNAGFLAYQKLFVHQKVGNLSIFECHIFDVLFFQVFLQNPDKYSNTELSRKITYEIRIVGNFNQTLFDV